MSDDNVIDIWGHDRFMSKPNGKLNKEEHTKYILEEEDGNVRVKRVTVNRKFMGQNDYIDSTEEEYLT